MPQQKKIAFSFIHSLYKWLATVDIRTDEPVTVVAELSGHHRSSHAGLHTKRKANARKGEKENSVRLSRTITHWRNARARGLYAGALCVAHSNELDRAVWSLAVPRSIH